MKLSCSPEDNTAILALDMEPDGFIVNWTPVGHRIATKNIRKGEPLLSWATPFGTALRDIQPGEWLTNQKTLEVFSERGIGSKIPTAPNFSDPAWNDYHYAEPDFQTSSIAQAPDLHSLESTFSGFDRGAHGVGSRNYVLILAINPLVNAVAETIKSAWEKHTPPESGFKTVDGVVAVCHSEGAGEGPGSRNNEHHVLRTLSGWITHPNVGGVLLVDSKSGWLNSEFLCDWMRSNDYPVDKVPLEILSSHSKLDTSLTQAMTSLRRLTTLAAQSQRKTFPISKLKIALQCGGSDAFSGVSANPLIGWIARRLVAFGGAANLAETDELIGAEPYLLSNVRSPEVAQQFLAKRDAFQNWARRHGHGAEGNPSGGNVYRGLTNIVIKSIGAARKKDPESTLDHVIDYSSPMHDTGYHFMDSPGNDLESVAGQVASGCSLIFFTTGNGSITNFPFVPTIKVMTQTERYQSLQNDMDINAGLYIDGMPMDELGQNAWRRMVEVASGKRTVGERTGLSQTQIWRNWALPGFDSETAVYEQPPSENRDNISTAEGFPDSLNIPLWTETEVSQFWKEHFGRDRILENKPPAWPVLQLVEWIAPTSLCSGQVALQLAKLRNSQATDPAIRCVATAHTEGCGVSGGDSEDLFLNTMGSYLKREDILTTLFLEHGCEKTHHGVFRHWITENGLNPDRYLWRSIQSDGGVASSLQRSLEALDSAAKLSNDSEQRSAGRSKSLHQIQNGDWRGIRMGWINTLRPEQWTPENCQRIADWIILSASLGAQHWVDQQDPLWNHPEFLNALKKNASPIRAENSSSSHSLHLKKLPGHDPVESMTHLGTEGLHLIHVLGNTHLRHPLISTLGHTFGNETGQGGKPSEDLDSTSSLAHSMSWVQECLRLWTEGGTSREGLNLPGAFQISRGSTGVSL